MRSAACARHGLAATAIHGRELMAHASRTLDASAPDPEQRLKNVGLARGPPWRQDEKYAALAALQVLGKRARTRLAQDL